MDRTGTSLADVASAHVADDRAQQELKRRRERAFRRVSRRANRKQWVATLAVPWTAFLLLVTYLLVEVGVAWSQVRPAHLALWIAVTVAFACIASVLVYLALDGDRDREQVKELLTATSGADGTGSAYIDTADRDELAEAFDVVGFDVAFWARLTA